MLYKSKKRAIAEAYSIDMLGREIKTDDYVVSFNLLYRVVLPVGRQSRIMLFHHSRTTKPILRASNQLCLVPKEDVTMWLLKYGTHPK